MTVFEYLKEELNTMSLREFADMYIDCSDVPVAFRCCEQKDKEWFKDFTCSTCKRAWLGSEARRGIR